jgi:DNA invertase Pin-like site-specific DNA recombinase
MARKSRKKLDLAEVQPIKKVYNVGAYIRLSAVDRKQKGDSLETQQAIIEAFIAEHSDMELREIYIDNGQSGQSFERPAFQQMLADMESGRINCCAVKDLSRLGRNAIDSGYYIEKYFPLNNIRFVAITDNYDSNDGTGGGIMLSLKNMINESYALDIGRKVHNTRQMNSRSGKFVGAFAPYGFQKDPNDGHRLVVDPYAAEVVKSIFEMFAEGLGVTFILNHLNEQNIMPPNLYRFTNSGNVKQAEKSNTYWTIVVIYQILNNRIYCGDMVQGRTTTKQYKTTQIPASELVITPNTHEPVISRELFEAVQAKKGTIKKSDKPKSVNVLAKKVYCGHCGYALHFERRTNRPSTGYFCTSRKYHGQNTCVPVSINGEKLREQVFEALHKQALKLPDSKPSAITTDNDLAEVTSELGKAQNFLKGLYESLILGDITDCEYKEMKSGYENKIAASREREKQIREAAYANSRQEKAVSKAQENIGGIKSVSDLTAEIVDSAIDKILVFTDKRIEISYKFSNKITVIGGASHE